MGPRVVRVLVALLLVSAAVAPMVVVATATESATPTPTGDDANETRHHVNPETSDRPGDLGATQGWLAGFMADRLSDGAIQLSQDQYELADRLIGEEYQDAYGKYVDVAGETGEDNATDDFRQTRRTQRNLTNATERYDELHEEYQRARQNGNTDRARELAREMDRVAGRVSRTGGRVIGNYGNLSRVTGSDFTDAMTAIDTTVENVTTRQAAVREDLFTETVLTVEANRTVIAFDRPVGIVGRLTTAAGEPIADRTATVVVGPRRYAVSTDDEGQFELAYRPVLLNASARAVTVRYEPVARSPYLPASASVPVAIRQVPSTLDVSVESGTVGIGDELAVAGTVRAAGREVSGLPVVVRLGDRRLDTATTDDGRVTVRTELPATTRADDGTVSAAVAVSNRAVARSADSEALRFASTATALTVTGTADGDVLDAGGRLTTRDGTPLPGRRIRLSVGDEVLATGRTGADGRYTVSVPAAEVRSRAVGREVTVTARYDGEPTLLDAARATDVVVLPVADSGAGSAGGDASPQPTPARDLAILAAVAVLLVAAWWFRDRLREATTWLLVRLHVLGSVLATWVGSAVRARAAAVVPWIEPPATTRAPAQAGGRAHDPPEPGSPAGPTRSVLQRARDSLREDPARAARLAFAETRRRLDAPENATHWEFYRDASDRVSDADALQQITQAYERAVYAGHIGRDEAERAVDLAGEVTAEVAADGGAEAEP